MSIDAAIVELVNQFAAKSVIFDRFVGLLTNNELLKGGVILGLFYWSWFSFPDHSRERRVLLITLITAPVAILVARLLALNLPFRLRPIHDQDIDFTVPIGVSEKALDGWSSFPSDHAVLFFSIAVGVWLASRRLGLLAIIYTLVFIGLPRVYAGYHYPTDILGGFVIGGIMIAASMYFLMDSPILNRITAWSDKHRGAFYALFFLITFQMASLFDQTRQIGRLLIGFLAN